VIRDFICPSCKNEWSMKADKDGLCDGYGLPPCPNCGTNGADPHDFGDFICRTCRHEFRNYGNGGLVLGMWPNCPKCGGMTDRA
jgi:uncharacterized Zn ribbon protein